MEQEIGVGVGVTGVAVGVETEVDAGRGVGFDGRGVGADGGLVTVATGVGVEFGSDTAVGVGTRATTVAPAVGDPLATVGLADRAGAGDGDGISAAERTVTLQPVRNAARMSAIASTGAYRSGRLIRERSHRVG